MQQPHEIIRFAAKPLWQVLESVRLLLQCGIVLFVITLGVGCTGKDQDRSRPGIEGDKSNPLRILRRGLPGEPRTLDPQLADDTFSFPVLRDLYEGLTAEDRNGQIVAGAAESWTIDSTGTVYTFHIRPNARWSNGDRTVAAEFVQGLRRAVDPQTASGSSALLAIIKNASEIIAGRKKTN